MKEDLTGLLKSQDPTFFEALKQESRAANSFEAAVTLNTFRRKAKKAGLAQDGIQVLKVAIVGGATLRPLADFIEHFSYAIHGIELNLWQGEYDNYISEILDPDSELYQSEPQVVLVLPSEARCIPDADPSSPPDEQLATAKSSADTLLDLCSTVHERSGAEIVLCNYRLSSGYDPGAMRWSSLHADYSYRKAVNLFLGLNAPPYVHLCDVEFLANRIGTLRSGDARTWFESKQPYSAELTVQVAKEAAHVIASLRRPSKKVLVMDLDNTLWGGVIGDDGVEGIELGTTSPRGEAFRAFQAYAKSLTKRGILLAVASKNDHEKAVEPFLSHPEMELRLEDIVSFKANWDPKSENIRQMATELALGIDSFVFVDDNPAEIEIVRQFAPEVHAIHLGEDPSAFIQIVQDARLFETRAITNEDSVRSEQYKREAQRQALKSVTTDMDSYLTSLEMEGQISDFTPIDLPRITQLIGKSNQFNLTTRRRTESEVEAVMKSPDYEHFTIRLSDRFGDHGLIAILIGKVEGSILRMDTWLMSCRVLKRQVEDLTVNEIVRRARSRGCTSVVGEYIPTAKNQMVANLYPSFGFVEIESDEQCSRFALDVETYKEKSTKIRLRSLASIA